MQVGAGPPFQNPPLVGDVGAPSAPPFGPGCRARAIPGRRTQTPGRSPCFRTLPGFLSSLRGAGRHGSLMTSPEPRPRANLLLVDDEPANLAALEVVLGPLEQRLVFARSGREALRHLLKEDFAAILLDV